MRIVVSLLLSLAVGCATYLLGAIAWCALDPEGAGRVLTFTIPLALAGAASAGFLGLVGMVLRCDWDHPRGSKLATTAPRATAPARPQDHSDLDEAELTLAA